MTYEEFAAKSKQKFLRGMRVKVADEMPPQMFHFEKGFVGIVTGSYVDHYEAQIGGRPDRHSYTSYSLAVLNKAGDKIVNRISWYDEDQLSLVDSDIYAGILLLQGYNRR